MGGKLVILPKEHPLSNVFAVGPESAEDRQRLAAEVVGFALGDRVVVVGTRRYYGKVGTVQTINPADIEVGVIFGTRLSPDMVPARGAGRQERQRNAQKAPGGDRTLLARDYVIQLPQSLKRIDVCS